MHDKSTTPPVQDAWAEGRDLANSAAAALQAYGEFTGSMLLDGGWELSSPKYIADIGRSLDEGRRAKDALHEIMGDARRGLGI